MKGGKKLKSKKRKKRVDSSRIIIALSFLFMIIIGLYTFLNSDIFNIKNIQIQGNNKVSDEIIEQHLDLKYDKNIFIYSTKKIKKSLEQNTYIETVSIKKIFPNTIQVNINEKGIVALIKDENKYCYIDNNLNVIDRLNEIDKNEKAIIIETEYDLNNENIIKFENDDIKKGLIYLMECISNNNLSKKIKKINYEQDIINMYSIDGTNIILENNNKLKYNISKVSSILVDLQTRNNKGGNIDLTSYKYAIYTP
jgi:cell division protein FtsQ